MMRILDPDAIWPNEMYLVCLMNRDGEEVVVQSERSPDRADYSVSVLNEHERNNARRESYFWKARKPGEIPSGRKHYLT